MGDPDRRRKEGLGRYRGCFQPLTSYQIKALNSISSQKYISIIFWYTIDKGGKLIILHCLALKYIKYCQGVVAYNDIDLVGTA